MAGWIRSRTRSRVPSEIWTLDGVETGSPAVGRRHGFRASRGTDDRWMPPTAYAIIILRRGRRQVLLWCQVEVALNWIEVDNLRAILIMVSRRWRVQDG